MTCGNTSLLIFRYRFRRLSSPQLNLMFLCSILQNTGPSHLKIIFNIIGLRAKLVDLADVLTTQYFSVSVANSSTCDPCRQQNLDTWNYNWLPMPLLPKSWGGNYAAFIYSVRGGCFGMKIFWRDVPYPNSFSVHYSSYGVLDGTGKCIFSIWCCPNRSGGLYVRDIWVAWCRATFEGNELGPGQYVLRSFIVYSS